MNGTEPKLVVVSANQVRSVLDTSLTNVLQVVSRTYDKHYQLQSFNPKATFIQWPDSIGDRIIALPASVELEERVAGIKWISSFPDNINKGLDRASAIVVLNNPNSGYPKAIMEGSLISLERTAASATLAACKVLPSGETAGVLGIVGAGKLAGRSLAHILNAELGVRNVVVHDRRGHRADEFVNQSSALYPRIQFKVGKLSSTIKNSDIVVIATTSREPYIHDPDLVAHNPLILHLSLRDLSASLLENAFNITDDIDHVLQAKTSLQLLHNRVGASGYTCVNLGITENLKDEWGTRPIVFSPFGLGILDVAVADYVLSEIEARGLRVETFDDFFPLSGSS